VGQPVAVTVKQSAEPGRVRFELNRSLTGQGHESYESKPEREETFGAVLASRLPGTNASELTQIITDLYQYWKPGMVPAVPTA
jgi:hypothetical protein